MPVCAICGRVVEKVASDHIPPKNLFGTKPNNLITEPSCAACNVGSSADDEYFRLIAAEVDTAVHPDAKKANEAIVRSMGRPQARRFRESLRRAMCPVEVASGDATEVKPFFGLDVRRLDRTAANITKGLFYHSMGYPVPANYKVLATNLDLFMSKPSSVDLAKLIYNYLLPKCSRIKPTVIGNNVFSYQVFFENDDANTVFILMQIYRRWRYFGLVLERSA
jgi:hypothetical protein